jgi:hypothetical protein
MIQLRAHGEPREEVDISLSQEGESVDIKINGEVVAYFRVENERITLQLCSLNEEFSDVAETLNLTEDGFLVAST